MVCLTLPWNDKTGYFLYIWDWQFRKGNWEVIYKDDLNQEQTPQPQIASLPSQSASQYKPNPDHQIGFLNPETSRLPYANDYASIAPQPLSIARASGTDYEYNKSIITSTPLTATEAPRQSLAAQGDSSKGDLYSLPVMSLLLYFSLLILAQAIKKQETTFKSLKEEFGPRTTMEIDLKQINRKVKLTEMPLK